MKYIFIFEFLIVNNEKYDTGSLIIFVAIVAFLHVIDGNVTFCGNGVCECVFSSIQF